MAPPSPASDWRLWLPALQGFPLIPCGAGAEGKAPINPATGAPATQWQHGAFTPEQIHAMNGVVLCCGTRCGPDAGGLLVFDLDGASAIEHCRQNNCDPATTTTWQVHRNTAPDRLKVAFRVPQQLWDQLPSKKKLVTKAATDGAKGEQIELFWSSGQVIVLGHHRETDGFYYWPQGRTPQELAEISTTWWALVQQIISPAQQPAQPPLPAPPRPAELSDLDRARAAIRHLDPGMSHDEWVEIGMALHAIDASAGLAIWEDWSRGSSKFKSSRELEQKWRSFKSQPGGIGPGTLFAKAKQAGWVDSSRQKAPPPTPPMGGETFIPEDAPAPEPEPWQLEPDDEDAEPERKALAVEISNYRDLAAAAELATLERILPPGLASIITTYAIEQHLKPNGFLLPILCSVCSIIGNRAVSAVEAGHPWTEACVLWGANIASASAGKSPTAGPAIAKPFKPWQRQERERHAAELQEWKHRRAQAERDAKAAAAEVGGDSDPLAEFLAENPQPELRHLLVSDATFEKIEMILDNGNNPGLLAYHDELANWFSQLCRAPNRSDRPKWLSLYTGEQIITDRVGRAPIFVPNPAVSLFGSLQPARLEGLWKADAEANEGMADADGLWARFLMFDLGEWSYDYLSSTAKLAQPLTNLYKQIDAAASILPPGEDDEPITISLAEDAVPTMVSWIRQTEAFKTSCTDPSDQQYWGKQRGTTLRIALAVHAIRQASAGLPLNSPISADALQSAIILTALFACEREKALGPVRGGAGGAIKRLLEKGRQWRQQHGSRPVPQSQIRAWSLPARRVPAKEVRHWLLTVVASMPGCGQVNRTGKAVEWVPPGD